MRLEEQSLLVDVQYAGSRIRRFTAGKTYKDYLADDMLRSAVERQFEIIGEALNQLLKRNPETAALIRDHRRIIDFRNLLIHGYASVDDRLVWNVVEGKLDSLLSDVSLLLNPDVSKPPGK